jgi:hypothetical protein
LAQEFRGLRWALREFYRAKIEATRPYVPARDLLAAIRTLIGDRQAALRALDDRRRVTICTDRERRSTERRAAWEATRRARTEANPRDGPV